ncbi:MAG: hypothetical protein Q9195_004977 [Heterodermia aff. obscurata]
MANLLESAPNPRRYAERVSAYSQRSPESFLHPGTNYRRLAQFLGLPYASEYAAASQHESQNEFPSVYLQWLDSSDPHSLCSFNGSSASILAELPDPETTPAKLVFLRGFQSPQWLNTLGFKYGIDPEFFRRHLGFLEGKDHFDLPGLPSSAGNILQLHVSTICTRDVAIGRYYIGQNRRKEQEAVRRYLRQLGSNGTCGDSIVRKLASINETTFVLEQTVHCCVERVNGGWTGMDQTKLFCARSVIWLDFGKSLEDSPPGPWGDSLTLDNMSNVACLPIIQHRRKAALQEDHHAMPYMSASRRSAQNTSLLATQYGSSLNRGLMGVDVMYALSDMIGFAAASEYQFLNLVRSQIQKEMKSFQSQMEISLANLMYLKALIDDHALQSTHTLAQIRSGGGPDWPRAPQEPLSEGTRRSLIADYEHLRENAQMLSAACSDGMDRITNSALIKESKKGILIQERLGRLTLLAFFFLPVSSTTSFFGMNFIEFGTGKLNIWLAFAVLIPAVLLSAMVCFWEDLARAVRRKRNIADRFLS